GSTDMQQPLGTAQTEQWSWILQTVWGWIWAGLSWILDWQALVFRTVLSGDSFWQIVGKFLLLFFPATVLVAGVWGTMVWLVALRHAGFEHAPAGGAVDRVHAAAVLVRHRGHDLHLHAASDDERAALGLDGLPGERAGPRRAPVVLSVHHHRGQLRLYPGAERGDQDSRHRAARLDGAGRVGGCPVGGA